MQIESIESHDPSFYEKWMRPVLDKMRLGSASLKQVGAQALDSVKRSGHSLIGLGVGRFTLGLADIAPSTVGKLYSSNKLWQKLRAGGVTVEDVTDMESFTSEKGHRWKLTDSKGNILFINPDAITEGTYDRDFGEVYASLTGAKVTPEMRAVYDTARFVGMLKPTHKMITKATENVAARPWLMETLRSGLTGITVDSLTQIEDMSIGKREEFSFKEAWKTGGWFTVFGGVVEVGRAAKTAVLDAMIIRKFLKSRVGIQALREGVTHAELKHLQAASRAAPNMSHKAWLKRYANNQALSKTVWKLDKAAAKLKWKPPVAKLLPEKAGLSVVEKATIRTEVELSAEERIAVRKVGKYIGLTEQQMQKGKLSKTTEGKYAFEVPEHIEPDMETKAYGTDKYSWQMTKVEHKRHFLSGLNRELEKLGQKPKESVDIEPYELHKVYVKLALSERKPVPSKVLADYPDLVSAAKEVPTTNPYLNMPISQVQEDAAQGVSLAKEALARLAPQAPDAQPVIRPATDKQKDVVDRLQTKHRLSEDELTKLSQYSTGELSIDTMTSEEAGQLINHLKNFDVLAADTGEAAKAITIKIDPHLPKNAQKRIRRIAKSDEVFNKTIIYSNKLGGVPSNDAIPDLTSRQKRYAKDLETVSRIQRRAFTKRVVKEEIGREYNALSPWSSARYAIGQAEVRSGVPLRRVYSNVVAEAVGVTNDNALAIDNALQAAGIRGFGSPTTFKEGVQISTWLFEEDETIRRMLFNEMPEKLQKLSTEYHKILQGRSASLVRLARWIKWDDATSIAEAKLSSLRNKGRKITKARLDNIMKPVKAARPRNAPITALKEGRDAKDIGQLRGWIDTQTWGTRKFYFMSEKELTDLTNIYPTGSIPEELEAAAIEIGKAPESLLPETMTREGRAKVAKTGSVTGAIFNHMNRVGVFAETHDDLKAFWDAFASTNPSRNDVALVRSAVNSALGAHHAVSPPIRIARGATAWMWRMYFLGPKRSAWFSLRNLHQNVAYGLSQVSWAEAAKSSAQLIPAISKMIKGGFSKDARLNALDAVNPWIRDDYEKYWTSRVSQRKQLQRNYMLQKQGRIVSDFGSKAIGIIDAVGSIPVYTDEINRLQAWPLMHQTAFRNVQKFIKGDISYNKLNSRLDIDTLHVSQRLELDRLIDEGRFKEFVANYAEYKTENIHFRYETSLRSMAEQTPAGRTTIGLMTFPRGTFEIMYQNGVKASIQGFQTKNYKQAYKGAKTVIFAMAGSRAARGLLYGITGRVAYGIFDTVFRYTPVTPGAARVKQMADDVSSIMWKAQEDNWPVKKTAGAMLAAGTAQLELFIPFCDVYLDYYETRNDEYGVRLFSLLKEKSRKQYWDETGKRFRTADRDYQEKLQHLLWGGAEKGKALGREVWKTKGEFEGTEE